MRHLRLLAAAGAGLLLAACSDQPTAPLEMEEPPAPAVQGRLDPVFAAAGKEFGVPDALLKAIGYTETRWEMVKGAEEFPGVPPAFGIMALRGAQLQRGAKLAGVTEEKVRTEPEANIRAAAALLRAYAQELNVSSVDLALWAPVVARYSGIESPQGRAEYVHSDVYGILNRGAVAKLPSGEPWVSLLPIRVEPAFPRPSAALAPPREGPRFATSAALNIVWRPSPNYNDRPTGDIGKVHMVIIHSCESGYTSCWSWLTNPDANASAHYVVREDGAEISKLVYESKRAWHIGATYDCSLNSDHECWRNGYSSNHFTVGIEHGGYASQTSWPSSQIDASAQLSCEISKRYGIPRDRYHYVAHGQLQPYNRTDPGANWPWSTYMNKINSYCSSAIIVDSNNNNNDTAKGYIEVSSNWTGSSSTSGYYGTGYYYAATQAISDPATFWFYLPAAASKTIDAWWTSGSNRSSTAPFIAWDANGNKLGTVSVNQQSNGGQWNAIGTWSFSAGWNKIQLSRWTTEGYVVIADAVRIR